MEASNPIVSEERLIGDSAATRMLHREIESLGPLPSTVLLTGETGVGKGVVARALHRASARGGRPLVHVDCAALSPTVVESELFGHERGAFTGAVARRSGCFERAGGGTLFLDEIGELAPGLQAKLLRVLQDREFERLGGERTLPMTARVLAATSRDLFREAREGRFRLDLYYRLAVLRVHIPPLRDRPDDVAPLAREAVARISRRLRRPVPELSEELCIRLTEQPWSGNVRELGNVVERLLVRHPGGRLDAGHLDGLIERIDPAAPLEAPSLLAPTSDHILRTLRATGGNVARAARTLGLPRSTLRHRIRREGLVAAP